MYEHVKSQVRHCNTFSEFIEVAVGLKQGEICSPLLWSIFIEDLELYLGSNIDSSVNIADTYIAFISRRLNAVIL
jgi:hypothetical protein